MKQPLFQATSFVLAVKPVATIDILQFEYHRHVTMAIYTGMNPYTALRNHHRVGNNAYKHLLSL